MVIFLLCMGLILSIVALPRQNLCSAANGNMFTIIRMYTIKRGPNKQIYILLNTIYGSTTTTKGGLVQLLHASGGGLGCQVLSRVSDRGMGGPGHLLP